MSGKFQFHDGTSEAVTSLGSHCSGQAHLVPSTKAY